MQEAFSSIQQHDKEYNKQRAQLNQKTTQHQEAQEAENLLEAL
jgi:hypothetical protein